VEKSLVGICYRGLNFRRNAALYVAFTAGRNNELTTKAANLTKRGRAPAAASSAAALL
jgi:hypothetical protein